MTDKPWGGSINVPAGGNKLLRNGAAAVHNSEAGAEVRFSD